MPTLAAKAATATIPIVFSVGEDPVKLGLVASLARPGGNVTGINIFLQEAVAKRLRLLHELVPKAVRIAVLINPGNASFAETTVREVQKAAPTMGLQIQILKATTINEIDAAFATLARERLDALLVAGDTFLISRRVHIATLTARDRIPAAYTVREPVEAGALMSYGTDLAELVSSTRCLYRPYPQRRKARRPAGAAVDQIRVCHQPHDCQGAPPRHSCGRAFHRRRGDRIMR